MSLDFKASQIRTTQLIVTGAKDYTPALIIYGSGSAINYTGTYVNTLLANVGNDAFVFISGSIGSKGKSRSVGTTVIGGDTVLSGTVYMPTAFQASGSAGITGSLVIKDDIANTSQLTLSSSAGSTIFNMYSDGNFYLTNNKSSGQVVFGVTQPDSNQSQVFKIYPQNNQRSLTVFNESLAGSSAANPVSSADTNFFVNGIVGSKTSASPTRGTAVFGGDLVVSGTIYNAAGSSYSVGGGGGGSGNWNELSPTPRLNTTASIAIAGGFGSSYAAQSAGSDVFFFVSGSRGSSSAKSTSGISLFNGDIVSSGSIYLQESSGFGVMDMTSDLTMSLRNRSLGGTFVASVNTTIGNTANFLDVRPNGAATNTKVAIMPGIYSGPISPFSTTDTNFFVGGSRSSRGGATGGTSVFGGDVVISGSMFIGTNSTDRISFTGSLSSDIIPDGNRTRNLGSESARFANVYTGDLHLKNERGDYTLIEEEDCLTIRFNKTGKRYRFLLEPAPEFDEK